MKKLLVISALLTLLFSCSKTDTDVADPGYDYFPLETGRYIVYNAKEITYDDFNQTSDTSIYQLKELIGNTVVDGEGREQFEFLRYRRLNDTLEWVLSDVWMIFRDESHAIRTEENEAFVKLAFPLKFGMSWDGNALNSRTSETYQAVNYDLNYVINDSISSQITRVIQRNKINLIEEIWAEEIYAKFIGLIEKSDVNVKVDTGGIPVSGYDYRYTYFSHGFE